MPGERAKLFNQQHTLLSLKGNFVKPPAYRSTLRFSLTFALALSGLMCALALSATSFVKSAPRVTAQSSGCDTPTFTLVRYTPDAAIYSLAAGDFKGASRTRATRRPGWHTPEGAKVSHTDAHCKKSQARSGFVVK